MSNNSTAATFCLAEDQQASTVVSVTILNLISVLTNILHIVVLKISARTNKKTYFWILVHMSVIDIVYSCIAIVHVVQSLPNRLNSLGKMIIWHVADGMLVAAMYARYTWLTLACFDRYYAVCRPFSYDSSKILNNINKVSLLVWITDLTYGITTVIGLPSLTCILRGEILKNFAHIQTILALVASLGGPLSFLIASTILLVAAYRELRRMKQRRNLQEEDKELTNSFRFIAGTFILLYVSLAPSLVAIILQIFSFPSRKSAIYSTTKLSGLLQYIFGISNVVFYALTNPKYVDTVKNRLGLLCSSNRIHHEDGETSELR
ncbi:olfactory receptor 2T34-like [Watersipora subatra]|uniref:olfactory receptor 2T34-like n=1 Tax=Watersipora subatra TaxID=2589382 RepID=UPI00355B81BE